jgi:hypothetical protein
LPDVAKWKLAEKFGWTLEYIDSLSLQDIHDYAEYNEIQDGVNKALAYKYKLKHPDGKKRRR